MTTSPLVLGPLIRFVDETSASVWVETSDSARVTLRAGDRSWDAPTFAAHDHHYAMVVADGLRPGTITPYTVEVDGATVWPPSRDRGEDGAEYPPSVIATLKPGKPLRMAFGSCRTSASHDRSGNKSHGIDALRTLALRMSTDAKERWPDLVLFLGDQVYADEPPPAMQEFIKARRDVKESPGMELKDFEEYAYLYRLAWSDPLIRWLLSTLPSSMIFDDHDIRDDWNTSHMWREEIEATDWWHERIVSGLGSYWVYQHMGNLSPQQREQDALWQKVIRHDADTEQDITADLDDLAERANDKPEAYSWSYARDFADARLVVVDSRAARVLEPGRRDLLDDHESKWLDGQMRGDVKHLLIGTSLPFLLPAGLHYLEAWSEALAKGDWGPVGAEQGEKVRRKVDLEHWAAFQEAFQEVARMATEVADGKRGASPETVTFLSGDVHHSYLAEVERERGPSTSRILQAVCSPIRNPLARKMRFATAALSYAVAGPIGKVVAQSAKVPKAPFGWRNLAGPWFDNSIAVLEDRPEGLSVRWYTGKVKRGRHTQPRLDTMADVLVAPR